jgi:hypothetical protein
MDYPETLLFVGQCLSLAKHPERKAQIKTYIQSGKVDWENVVKVSSGQFILPALYVRLREANLLGELPSDLTEYIEHLTNLNRQRNQRILEQAEEINQQLISHGIHPVFLKGTAFLLIGLYDDIAERMAGDIDLLVKENVMEEAANILVKNGYKPLVDYRRHIHGNLKHYPRLITDVHVAAVEVHRQVVKAPHDLKFPAKNFLQHKQKTVTGKNIFVPSYRDMMVHNVLNVQLNDKAFMYHTIHMRHMYDMLLLSMKEDPDKVFEGFGHYKRQTNAWLMTTSEIMNLPDLYPEEKTVQLKCYIKKQRLFLKRPNLHKVYNATIYLAWRFSRYITIMFKAIYNKEERLGLYTRLSDPKWYGKHLKSYQRFLGR